MKLPCEQMKAELDARLRDYRTATGEALDFMDADLTLEVRCGDFYLGVNFQDGPAWLLPFDAAGNAYLQGLSSVRH